jgi:OOP family OmpA-OmpF porin
MRAFLFTAASLLVVGLGSSAFAASAEDAAYDKNDGPVIDSRGNCVRTKWQDTNDPCAAPAPAPKPIARPVAKPAPAPVVTNEQRTIYFDFNKATLTPEATAKLDQLAAIVNSSTAINDITIHGFTDQLGTDSYNQALANKRVEVTKAYLDSKTRLQAQQGDIRGLGKAAPEAECSAIKKRAEKIDCMAKERRVEVEFNVQK